MALRLVRLNRHYIERVSCSKGGGGRHVRVVLLVLIIRVGGTVGLYGYRLGGVLMMVREEIFDLLFLLLNHVEVL